MNKILQFFYAVFFLIIFLLIFIKLSFAYAQNSFVTIVNPVRGSDFWDQKNQKVETAFLGEYEILRKFNLSATWLLRYDVLSNEIIVNQLKNTSDEKGLFLEITPQWTNDAGIPYHKGASWHSAASAFLTGYEQNQREKLIDASFEKFKKVFGYFPKSVGAWWIDSYSLSYMQKKYSIISSLLVSDQYSTDNYQIWGQYWSTPYYPSKNNALHPAQSLENKLPIVMIQWAPRDPVNGYGNGVLESTYSVQANDYIDYHNLDTKYFSKLVDLYTSQPFNQFGQLVIGLENSYSWDKYKNEYENQIRTIVDKKNSNQLSIVTMENFANWYKTNFPDFSPASVIVSDDPLGSSKKTVWYMDPFYRAGWFYDQNGSNFRDIRQYTEGSEELCLKVRCDQVNFATSATRVLDDVSFGHKWIIDNGKVHDFKVSKEADGFIISYKNEADKLRKVGFLPRDISIDGKISSIDGAILDVIEQDTTRQKKLVDFKQGGFSWTIQGVILKTIGFLIFLLLFCLIPGFVLLNNIAEKQTHLFKQIFLSLVVGIVELTMLFYLGSLLHLRIIVLIYIIFNLYFFFKLKLFTISAVKYKITRKAFLPAIVIIAGTVFQNIPMFRNGLIFPYGMGFWGPNTHDGIWHISLINQLVKGFPIQNPIFANTVLKNYHFFYDLLIAATVHFTKLSALDLVFRFYPLLFSLLLGIGTYYLTKKLLDNKFSIILGLYFVYFSGSFGWIVDYIKNKSFGGESAFWANQSISFNLNPPFAISLLIIIAFLLLVSNIKYNNSKTGIFVSIILLGSLVGFKSYGAVLTMASVTVIAIINLFKRQFIYLYISIFSIILSLIIFISNFVVGQQLMIFSPFWFIHSMVDSTDRVGWARLSIAREAGLATKNWFKFISAEIISLSMFIFGNLGIRFFGLLSIFQIKRILRDENLLFLLIFFTLSFLIPILFIQSGNPWNTIQFSYYGLYIAALTTGSVLISLISRLPKLFSTLILFCVVALAPINSITTSSYYTGVKPHARVDPEELQALEFLSRQEGGTVLTYPYDQKLKQRVAEPWSLFVYDSSAYVSALSNKAVFLEDEPQNQILLTDYKKRRISSKDFFLKNDIKFLKDNNIKYIYLPKIFNTFLDIQTAAENIFENDKVIIYKVK